MPIPSAARAQLTAVVGERHVITEPDQLRVYDCDGLTGWRAQPELVVLPGSTEEVQGVLRTCSEHGIPFVARGAGTGLSGGALPVAEGIVISLARMNRILEVDLASQRVVVQPGVANLDVTKAVAPAGFFYAPDPSSQLACTLAGNIGMNSGGAHCLKYGVTTNNILGLKMVLMDGEVIEIGGAHLDSPGYDLMGLVIGSEGQLGIATEATVRILRAAEGAQPMLLGFDSSEAAGQCVSAIIGAGIVPVAIEFMDKPAIQVCEAFAKAGYPLDVEALLIIEVEGSDDEIADLLAVISNIAKKFDPKAVRISQGADQSAAIWKGRKAAFGAIGRISDYYCMDGVIPLGKLGEVLVAISHICDKHNLRVANIFHAGDGNLHPLVLYDANDPVQADRAEQAGHEILELCVASGGCLTGEHGVGIEKRDLMRVQFNETDLDMQMRVKAVFDPKWLLNPSKVFPLDGRRAVAEAA
jgi:glycolate oxidase